MRIMSALGGGGASLRQHQTQLAEASSSACASQANRLAGPHGLPNRNKHLVKISVACSVAARMFHKHRVAIWHGGRITFELFYHTDLAVSGGIDLGAQRREDVQPITSRQVPAAVNFRVHSKTLINDGKVGRPV